MNRIALITGASRGLGKTLAGFLAAQGADLVITARGETDLRATARELEELGSAVIAIPGDITDEGHRLALAHAVESLGGLDLLINNASTLGTTPLPALVDYPLDMLATSLEVNVIGPLALLQAVLPSLIQRRGLVVNISSDAAVGGYPGWGAYGATKAALDLMSATLANELRKHGIGVVSVDPGDMRTRMYQDAFPDEDISDRPLPLVTLPFWGWLLGQSPLTVSGRRFQAQGEEWLVRG